MTDRKIVILAKIAVFISSIVVAVSLVLMVLDIIRQMSKV